MSRLENIFRATPPGRKILNIYCTAGYPRIGSLKEIMHALQQNNVPIMEIGIPYSDPLADGPVIQKSNSIALHNGMTIKELFAQLKGFRQRPGLGETGVVLMGYMNPVLQYGFEKFCADAATAGIDGLIIPDLPEFEFENEYGPIIKRHNLDFIFLITPETSAERIKKLDSLGSGFLYAVSSSSTTGKDKSLSGINEYLSKLKKMGLKNPVLVGFGIKDKASFDAACSHAEGAIIGSAFIKALENAPDIHAATSEFISSILG
jgi:tryptophan synthase alpha chain